jgi:hypothetical protein
MVVKDGRFSHFRFEDPDSIPSELEVEVALEAVAYLLEREGEGERDPRGSSGDVSEASGVERGIFLCCVPFPSSYSSYVVTI